MTEQNLSSWDDVPPPDRILDIAAGYEPALILEAAVRLNVFDALDDRPLTLGEVVEKTRHVARGMRALLNALVAIDLLFKQGDQYGLTPESSAYLVTTKPGYQGYMCKHVSRHLLKRWMRLTEVVRTGKPDEVVNEPADGGAYFREFVEDIFPMSYEAAQALAAELRVAEAGGPVRVLDLAAGSGVWGVALAEASPRVTVTAVDWPIVLPATRKVAERHKVVDRFTFVPGDLRSADFGSGHHVATLGHIIHSEGEERSRQLAPQDVRRARARRDDRDRRVHRRRGPGRAGRGDDLRRHHAGEHRCRRHLHVQRDAGLAGGGGIRDGPAVRRARGRPR
jgi:hypothetical protein